MFLKKRSNTGSFEISKKRTSDRNRFTSVVIGVTRTSIHDFNKEVGIEWNRIKTTSGTGRSRNDFSNFSCSSR